MTNYEMTTIIISGFSAVIALVALYISNLAKDNSTKSNSAIIELSINNMITNTKEAVSNRMDKLTDLVSKDVLTNEEKTKLEIYTKQLNAAIENNLNAYEEACAKYIDDKLDKVRFKKSYKTEIKNIVENKDMKKYFDGVSSNYKAILKIYKEWEDLEN